MASLAIFDSQSPRVSVLICTRNRKHNVVMTVQSILNGDYAGFEVIVIDQSDEDSTYRALSPLLAEENRVHYLHADIPGKPYALNLGRTRARGSLLALTDDDCEADSAWLRRIVEAFDSDPRYGCVFGTVTAAPHDPGKGYLDAIAISQAVTILHVRDYMRLPGPSNFGMGANMAVRAEVLEQLGGWDPCIGPGAKFGSGDDVDLTLRTLLAG